MNVITIPKRVSGGTDDLVVIPRKEYESLKARVIPEVPLTAADKRALARARKAFAEGKVIPWEDVKRELADRRRARRT